MRIDCQRCCYGTLVVLCCLMLISCSKGNPMAKLGIHQEKLTPCPTSPNCVSSDAAEEKHQIGPFQLTVPPDQAWQAAQKAVEELQRCTIISAEQDYLHAECRSALFGFVDDLELHLRPQEELIAVRSAARLGYSDFGVNRKRVEALRGKLAGLGIIAP